MIETPRAAPIPTMPTASTAGAAGAPTMSIPTMPTVAMRPASMFDKPRVLWAQHREAALNWLAFGLLLAAWNAADGADSHAGKRRPDVLRAYPSVSVRAVMRANGT
ncbi:MAG TPA: hypothetical protein VKP66_14005 [Steroidobacteraceae bacterium]|nr:hypothetical protein [Steroidobacteraceae bacterium]